MANGTADMLSAWSVIVLPQDPKNRRPIYDSTAMYSIVARLLLNQIMPGPDTGTAPHTTRNPKWPEHNNTHRKTGKRPPQTEGYVALLDVAQTFHLFPVI